MLDPHDARTAVATDWMKVETNPFVDEGSLHLDGEDSAVPGEVGQDLFSVGPAVASRPQPGQWESALTTEFAA